MRVYVPIGCGSGISGMIAWREALGSSNTKVIGVVLGRADLYAALLGRRRRWRGIEPDL